MELKVRILNWSAGIPVAMLNEESAERLGIHIRDRIKIKTSSGEISTIVDIVGKLIKNNEIAISSEIKDILGLKNNQIVDIDLASSSLSLTFIKKKLNNKSLNKKEIEEIIKDITNNSLSEAEIALFISAMYKFGMSFKETTFLIDAIIHSGNRLNINRKVIADKHSIGGIAGNRTTPIVVAICASLGLTMPKTSSRAITSAAGTADVIETIAKIEFSIKELENIVKKTNACMVWGGCLGIVPADDKMIQIEKMLKIDPESQLLASIMSKKLAVGSNYILIDIPYGKSAKVTKEKAIGLKDKFERLGKHFKRKLQCVLTDGSEPIGNGIGPALEIIDVIKVLNRDKTRPLDLEKKSVFLSGKLLEMTNKAQKGQGEKLALEALNSGKAMEKFEEIIKAQKGQVRFVKLGKFKKDISANKKGKIAEISNTKISSLARTAGCPADKYSGLYLHCHVNDKVKKGQKIFTIYTETPTRMREALKHCKRENPVKIG
ncbi:MAG: thymidine phosphorylase [archaeon]|nr:thymidine phosphorylase [archaeon]